MYNYTRVWDVLEKCVEHRSQSMLDFSSSLQVFPNNLCLTQALLSIFIFIFHPHRKKLQHFLHLHHVRNKNINIKFVCCRDAERVWGSWFSAKSSLWAFKWILSPCREILEILSYLRSLFLKLCEMWMYLFMRTHWTHSVAVLNSLHCIVVSCSYINCVDVNIVMVKLKAVGKSLIIICTTLPLHHIYNNDATKRSYLFRHHNSFWKLARNLL